jgi:hypothetical protein
VSELFAREIRPEFEVGNYGPKCEQVGKAFSALLDELEQLLPVGRERSLVLTKLQEAQDWALRGIKE